MLPNLVIIGAQKSASSYLQLCLDRHPDLYLVKPEVPFFSDPYYDPQKLDEVAALLPAGQKPKVFGIKRPDYLGNREVPARLAEHLPDAKLIAVLREPVARLVSAYYHFLRYGLLPMLPLNEGMARVFEAQPGPGFQPERALLEYGCYGSALRRYLQHFPRERMHILLHDQVTADAEASMNQCLEFLGLESMSLPAIGRRNEGIYSYGRIRYLRAVQTLSNRIVPSENRWEYRWGPFGMAVWGLARQIDKRILAPLCNQQPEDLDPKLRTRLDEYYAPEIAATEEILGRALSSWRGGRA
ncbi:MAG: sulfotransferase family protein [Planctomycetota bacterium]|jgi:hypothetical protein